VSCVLELALEVNWAERGKEPQQLKESTHQTSPPTNALSETAEGEYAITSNNELSAE
jgi:hypothetical protein